MSNYQFTTAGKIVIDVYQNSVELNDALEPIFQKINTHKGAIFSSGFDYPGRHSRWDIGFIDPALEFIARGPHFELNALSQQGIALLQLIAPALNKHEHIADLSVNESCIRGQTKPRPTFIVEEERSKQASIFSVLRQIVKLFHSDHELAAHFGLYGAFGYDLIQQFEDIKLVHLRSNETKDCHLYFPLKLILVDRKKELASTLDYNIETPLGNTREMPGDCANFEIIPGRGSSEILCDHLPGEFAAKVEKVVQGAAKGDYFEVVLSQSFETRFDHTPTDLYKRFVEINPSPYLFLIQLGDEQLVGSSPEIYVRVSGKRYETCPIAGTIPRGQTAIEDAEHARELLSSRKDESELTMCTDVDRNDMARVCVPGSVQIIGRRQLEFYSHLIHTVDHLDGTLADQFDALDAFQTHMWACTVTGAPKPAAVQEIENLEASPRGWYSGAVGLLAFNGDLNTGITLRTAELKNGRAKIRAGATLLFESNPIAEEEETRTKAAIFLAALAAQNKVKIASKNPAKLFPSKSRTKKNILIVDFHDSFAYNLASYLRELNTEVTTVRPGFPRSIFDQKQLDLVVLSPGPGTPEQFGVPDFVGELIQRKIPIFGVCLGHQGIGQHFGATLGQLPLPEHGKQTTVIHNHHQLFKGINPSFDAGLYHSLYLIPETIPDTIEVIAKTAFGKLAGSVQEIPMAIKHKTLPIAAVQFHPESLMSLKDSSGYLLLNNVLDILT